MVRRIIEIDRDKCNGCGACAEACHEGAIAMVDGKAQLMRDDYCDGLGDCLPTCPTGAITFVEREAAAYAYAAFHERFIKGHITLVGCPKLDSVDYAEKLTEIIRENDIKSVTVVRMEVPCCGGLELAAKKALQQSEKFIPWQVVTVTVDGRLVEE